MKKSVGFLCFYFLTTNLIFAQHQELSEKPLIWQGDNLSPDSNSILSAFKKGKIKGHFRYYFHLTDQQAGLSDHYAHALGGGLKYETLPLYGFQLGISAFYLFNLNSSDLNKPDPTTNQPNRYEIGLFDINNPKKTNMGRFEELYLKYKFRNSSLTFGSQLINTPFINLQDGRMRPTIVEGVWLESQEIKNTEISVGFFYRISPRSTVDRYYIAHSFGIYPVGVDVAGKKSGYKNQISTIGVGILGVNNRSIKNVKIEFWDFWVENVFNTFFTQVEFSPKFSEKKWLILGVQSSYQFAINNGGNPDPAKAYIAKGATAFTYGAKLGLNYYKVQTSFNFNRIVDGSRFLMPREWGRDPFYTFMPRERNEGLADATALMYQIAYKTQKWHYQVMLGRYWLPKPDDYAKNKYTMPAYSQINLDIRYQFSGALRGLNTQFLFVHKLNSSGESLPAKFVYNRVNMSIVNLILNFRF